MKKVRTTVNIILGSMVAAIGLTGCEGQMVKYGVPFDDDTSFVDTTVICMYGVPNPDWNDSIPDDEPTNEEL